MPVEKKSERFVNTQTGGVGETPQMPIEVKKTPAPASDVGSGFGVQLDPTKIAEEERQARVQPSVSNKRTKFGAIAAGSEEKIEGGEVEVEQPSKPSVPNEEYWKKIYDWTVKTPKINQTKSFDDFVSSYSSDPNNMWKLYSTMYKKRGSHPLPISLGSYDQFQVDAFSVEQEAIKEQPTQALPPERDADGWLTEKGTKQRNEAFGIDNNTPAAPAYAATDLALNNVRNQVSNVAKENEVKLEYSKKRQGVTDAATLSKIEEEEKKALNEAKGEAVDPTVLQSSKDILGYGSVETQNPMAADKIKKLTDDRYQEWDSAEILEDKYNDRFSTLVDKETGGGKTLEDYSSTDFSKYNNNPNEVFGTTEMYQKKEINRRNQLEDDLKYWQDESNFWSKAVENENWDAAYDLPFTKVDEFGMIKEPLTEQEKKDLVMKAYNDSQGFLSESQNLIDWNDSGSSPDNMPKISKSQEYAKSSIEELVNFQKTFDDGMYGKGALMANGSRSGQGSWSNYEFLDEYEGHYRSLLDGDDKGFYAYKSRMKNDFADAWADLEEKTGKSFDDYANVIEGRVRQEFERKERRERLFQDEDYITTQEGYYEYEAWRNEQFVPQFNKKATHINRIIKAEVDKRYRVVSEEIQQDWKEEADAAYKKINSIFSPKYQEIIDNSPEAQEIKNKYQKLASTVSDEKELSALNVQYNDELQNIEPFAELAKKHQAMVDNTNSKLEMKYNDELFIAQKKISDWSSNAYYENMRGLVNKSFGGKILSAYDPDTYVGEKIRNNVDFKGLTYGDKKKSLNAEWNRYKSMVVKDLNSATKKIPATDKERDLPWWQWTGTQTKTEAEKAADKKKISLVTGDSARREFMYHALDEVLFKNKKKEPTVYAIKAHAEEVKHDAEKLLQAIKKGTHTDVTPKDLTSSLGEVWGFHKEGDLKWGGSGDPKSLSLDYLDDKMKLEMLVSKLDEVIKHPEHDQTFWGGFSDGFSGEFQEYVPFVSSILDLGYNYSAYKASQKMQDGEALSEMESMVLDQMASTKAINDIRPTGTGYNVGSAIKHMIPFVGEFALTLGAGGLAVSGTKGLVKNAVTSKFKKQAQKEIGEEIVESTAKVAARDAAGSKVSKGAAKEAVGSKLVTDVIKNKSDDFIKNIGESGVSKYTLKSLEFLVNTIGQTTANPQQYVNNTLQRMTPEVALALTGELDDVMVQIQDKGEGFMEAFVKGYGMTWAEMATEQMGGAVFNKVGRGVMNKLQSNEYLQRTILGGWMRTKNFVSKSDAMAHIVKNNLGWHGIMEEYAEEFVNGRLQALITGDKGVWDIDAQEEYETFLTVAIFGGAMKGIQLAKGTAQSAVTKGERQVTLNTEITDVNDRKAPLAVDLERKTWNSFNKLLGKKDFSFKDMNFFLENNDLTRKQKDVLQNIYIQTKGKSIKADPSYQEAKGKYEEEVGEKVDDNWLDNDSGLTEEAIEETKEQVPTESEVEAETTESEVEPTEEVSEQEESEVEPETIEEEKTDVNEKPVIKSTRRTGDNGNDYHITSTTSSGVKTFVAKRKKNGKGFELYETEGTKETLINDGVSLKEAKQLAGTFESTPVGVQEKTEGAEITTESAPIVEEKTDVIEPSKPKVTRSRTEAKAYKVLEKPDAPSSTVSDNVKKVQSESGLDKVEDGINKVRSELGMEESKKPNLASTFRQHKKKGGTVEDFQSAVDAVVGRKETKAAVAEREAKKKADVKNADAAIKKGDALMEEGKPAEAVKEYQKAKELGSEVTEKMEEANKQVVSKAAASGTTKGGAEKTKRKARRQKAKEEGGVEEIMSKGAREVEDKIESIDIDKIDNLYDWSDSLNENGLTTSQLDALRRDGKISEIEHYVLSVAVKQKYAAWKKKHPEASKFNNTTQTPLESKDSAARNKMSGKNKRKGQAQMRNETRLGTFLEDVVNRLKKAFPNVEVFTTTEEFYAAAFEDGWMPHEIEELAGLYVDGKVYLNPSLASGKTAIEEFGHLWAVVAEQTNPNLYSRGEALAKESGYYDEVKNDPRYSHLTEKRILNEAIAKSISDAGSKILESEENAGIIKKFTQWLSDLWKSIKKGLGVNPRINLNSTTLNEYAEKVAKDLLGKFPMSSSISSEQLALIELGQNGAKISVSNSVLSPNNAWDKISRHYNSMFKEYKGAGKEYGQRLIDANTKTTAWAKKAEMELRNYETSINRHLDTAVGKVPSSVLRTISKLGMSAVPKKYQDIQTARNAERVRVNQLVDSYMKAPVKSQKELLNELPSEVSAFAYNMRGMLNNLQAELHEMLKENNLINGNFEATLTSNQGVWVHRSYMMHDVPNYAEHWDKVIEPDKDVVDSLVKAGLSQKEATRQAREMEVNKIRGHIAKSFGDPKVSSISWEKTADGGVTYTFMNKAGLVSSYDITDSNKNEFNSVLRDIIPEHERRRVKREIKNGIQSGEVSGSVGLKGKVNETDSIPFSLSDADITGIINDLVSTSSTMALGSLTRIGTGKWESSVLRKKGEIDEPIRKLMGEYLDPKINFMKSVMKVSMMVEKGKIEMEMLNQGEGSLFVSGKKITAGQKDRMVEITNQQSHLLSGYYTTPEIADLLYGKKDGIFNLGESGSNVLVQGLVGFNSLVKASLTIFKDDSQARNFIGAAFNLAATGHFANPKELVDATLTATADFDVQHDVVSGLMSTPLALSQLAAWTYMQTKGDAKAVEIRKKVEQDYLEAVQYGLIDESAEAGVVKDSARNLYDNLIEDNPYIKMARGTVKGYKATVDAFSKPYQASDAIFKIVQFRKEIENYDKVYRTLKGETSESFDDTSQEYQDFIKSKAAQLVRAEQPTYSKSSDFFRYLSRMPLAGSFIMFQSQMWRTRGAIIGNIRDMSLEAKSLIEQGHVKEAAQLNKMKNRRIGGMIASLTFTPAMAAFSMWMAGVSFDDDEAVSEFFADYSENSIRIYLDGNLKDPKYLDMSFVDPSSQWHKMVVALLRGDDFNEKITGFIKELYEPFISEEIGLQAIREAVNNRDSYGRPVVPESWDGFDAFWGKFKHAISPAKPGFLNTFDKLKKGYHGEKTNYGVVYDFANEFVNSRAGMKMKDRDMTRAFQSKVRGEYKMFQDSKKTYKNNLLDVEVSESDKKESFRKQSAYAEQYFNGLVRKYNKGLQLGFTPEELRKLMGEAIPSEGKKEKGVDKKQTLLPKYLIDAVQANKFSGIDPETGDIIGAKKKAKPKSKGLFDNDGLGGSGLDSNNNLFKDGL